MKSPRALLLALLLVLTGCGGSGGTGDPRIVSVTSSAKTLAVGATSIVEISQIGYGEPGYALSVQEGAAGGTLTTADFDGPVNGINRIYTAPATPGTYHIVGTVTEVDGKTHTRSLAVVVTAVLSQ